MQIKEYLEEHQPIVYKTFTNAVKDNRLSHAYLLSGSSGMPLKEAAIYLAKTIVCDNPNPLACDNCITCARIDEGNYPDFMLFDGEESKIKKGDIEKIISNFDKSALEEKGVMIYVLHLVETMTSIAVNSLLKFLEEPGKNIYAFLTTENETKILPTIISRTQVLRFKSINRQKVIENAISAGIFEEDAQLLSTFYNDPESIKAHLEDENYLIAKEALVNQINALAMSKDDAIFTCQKFVISKIKNYETARMYLKLLAELFQDLLNLSVNGDITLKCYDNILQELLSHLTHLEKSLTIIMTSISRLDLNLNIPLLLDHIIYEITKEEK